MSWKPSRKWIAAQVVALGGLATSAIESGWDNTESTLLVGIVVQALVTYLLPNDEQPPTDGFVAGPTHVRGP